MRILIQHPVSKDYFDGQGWVAEIKTAREFESVSHAETFCQEQKITRAFIVVKFNDPQQDIRYPIGPKDALLTSNPPTTRIHRVA